MAINNARMCIIKALREKLTYVEKLMEIVHYWRRAFNLTNKLSKRR